MDRPSRSRLRQAISLGIGGIGMLGICSLSGCGDEAELAADSQAASTSVFHWRCAVDTGRSRLIFDKNGADFAKLPDVNDGRPFGTTGAIRLTGFAAIEDTVRLASNAYVFVQVKARAQTTGTNAYPPILQVRIDHQQVANFEVTSSSWQTYGSWTAQSGILRSPLFDAGNAVLEVDFINDWVSPDGRRGRNVDIEWVQVFIRREQCSGYHGRFANFLGIQQPRNFADRLGISLGTISNYQGGQSQFSLDSVYRNKLKRMFRNITPENQFKMRNIVKSNGQLDFRVPDQFIADAQTHSLTPLHGHTLVWYLRPPELNVSWRSLGPTNSPQTNFRRWLNNYIETTVRRYSGKFKTWHVVNEPLDWRGNIRTGHVFHDMLGNNYIRIAFEAAARARAPQTRLIINENRVLDLNEKSDGLYRLVKNLRSAGVPVDGIGIQAHLRLNPQPNFNSIRANIERFARLGVDVHITELDVRINRAGRWRERAQADQLYHVVSACLDVPRCRSVSLWGFTDKYAVDPNNRPLLLTPEYGDKPNLGGLNAALRRGLGLEDYID